MAQLLLKGHPIGNFQGVLFDKDGTLSHSEPHLLALADARINKAVNIAQEQAPALKSSELINTLRRTFGVDQGMLDPGGTLAVASRQDNIASTATVFCLLGCSWPQALYLAHTCFDAVDQDGMINSTQSPLIIGARHLLQDLHQQGVTAAVISNDTRSGIADFLAHHQLSGGFAGIWSADDHPRKPDPQAVLELCGRLGLPPQRCALVGDAETDLQMALEAGIGGVIGFTGGWKRAPELPSAQHLLHSWTDLALCTAT
ncbi:HAD-superfamily hydrolase subfamily IA, variant 3 [Synechococcus sp. WH 8109]|uniref:HAD family hydrolase n=1 Tax=Synechococcus sp. WH 8109 TaxID=166314 RepID=UPI0001B8D3CE|nr:HAD-IA family hydrolase [Synechococcus sp. WH 8109]AHF62899.1 HAD-superfamily hydrolase subfamily IA, variant 3 [Synechococcus sp. WH 8109]